MSLLDNIVKLISFLSDCVLVWYVWCGLSMFVIAYQRMFGTVCMYTYLQIIRAGGIMLDT